MYEIAFDCMTCEDFMFGFVMFLLRHHVQSQVSLTQLEIANVGRVGSFLKLTCEGAKKPPNFLEIMDFK